MGYQKQYFLDAIFRLLNISIEVFQEIISGWSKAFNYFSFIVLLSKH